MLEPGARVSSPSRRRARTPHGDRQAAPQRAQRRAPPGDQRPDPHQQQQRQPEDPQEEVVVGRPHGHRLAAHGLGDERVHDPPQHGQRERHQQQVVVEERRLPRAERLQPRLRAQQGSRQTITAVQNATTTQMKARNQGPIDDCVKAWIEEITPDRVRNVPNSDRQNVSVTSMMFHTFSMSRRSWTITECRNAVAASHGMNAAFSTGSQAQ